MDPRLQQLEKVWLKGMKVLDIGCGSGVVDILLGVRYEPKLVIGVDIDHQMIKTSIDNMQKVINDQESMAVLLEQARKERSKED